MSILDSRSLLSQVIDSVTEQLPLRCTHFDAFRFFAKGAQPLNALHLTREAQLQKEQPGCIHAIMDLFKFAYMIYPLCSAELLRSCLKIATKARFIDMRASPYDVSAYAGCEEALCVETAAGRAQYAREQEGLFVEAQPLRRALLEVYDAALLQLALSEEPGEVPVKEGAMMQTG